jgi:nucleoside-diphosphate-sugar epimerase
VVDGNLRALAADTARGEVLNVATGTRVTLNRLLATLARQLGRKVRPRYLPARAGDVRHSLADVTRARQKLGYRPLVDFETGLRETVAWYRAAARGRR